jgi:hypothetical protein
LVLVRRSAELSGVAGDGGTVEFESETSVKRVLYSPCI